MTVYFLRIRLEFFDAEVFLNGVPILDSAGGFMRTSIQVNEWVVAGENTIEVEVRRALPTPTGSPEKAVIDVALCRTLDDQMPGMGSSETLAAVVPPRPDDPMPNLPFSLHGSARLPANLPRWRWQDAQKLGPRDGNRTDLIAFVTRIHGITSRLDVAGLEAEIEPTFAEVAPSYGYPSDFARQEYRKAYGAVFGEPDFRVEPLDPSRFAFRICADDRLIEARNLDGRPTIREDGLLEKGGWFLTLFLGLESGRWAILR